MFNSKIEDGNLKQKYANLYQSMFKKHLEKLLVEKNHRQESLEKDRRDEDKSGN